MRRLFATLVAALILSTPALSQVISSDTKWSGTVTVFEDVRVLPGVTLTIEPSTKVLIEESLSTKTEPEFWNPDTEISVEGILKVKGEDGKPVSFEPVGSGWGGIVVAPGGKADIEYASISRAGEGILLAGGTLKATRLSIISSEYGLVVGHGGSFDLAGVSVEDCKVGFVGMGKDRSLPEGLSIGECEDARALFKKGKRNFPNSPAKIFPYSEGREFIGEYTVSGEERWSGVVIISGRVTVPPESSLVLEPGTRVGFRRRDSNQDGLGEGEILVTGRIRSLGTKEKPVIFESAEADPAPGDWDKVSIISSMSDDNLFTHTTFRHGLQALHAHFSSLTVEDSLFEENLRGFQFQESDSTVVKRSRFFGNKQAIRFRDSNAVIEDCQFRDNDYALHLFRADLSFNGNSVAYTNLGGFLAKESVVRMEGNIFHGSRAGVRAKGEGSDLKIEKSHFSDFAENAVSLSEVDGDFSNNTFRRAGLDLIGVDASKLILRENELGRSGRHVIHLSSQADVDARKNFWNLKIPIDDAIFDSSDEDGLGTVIWKSSK